MTTTRPPRRFRQLALHVARVLMFVVIVLLIHAQHTRLRIDQQNQPLAPIDIDPLTKFFPKAHVVSDEAGDHGQRAVLDSAGQSLGYVLQTAPGSDSIIGFSGPTNTLIAFDPKHRILGIKILSSGDTREHVSLVVEEESFMTRLKGLSWEEALEAEVDAVSGATLTSLAIQEGILQRLSEGQPSPRASRPTSLRFPDPLTLQDARAVFQSARGVERDEALTSLWHVKDDRGQEIGSILRTAPFADNVIGYQGPTETRIYFDDSGRTVGIALGKSYDNAEYVAYVREDEYFLTLFNNLLLKDLAKLDLEAAQVEGVSGATMTSMTVAQGLIIAAKQQQQALETVALPPPKLKPKPKSKPGWNWTLGDLGTTAVILAGLVIAFTSLRGKKIVRVGFQVLLIGYLGLVNGEMLSQAMLVGWAQDGVPWKNAGGLVLLTVAAFLVPITTRRNPYCSHLCPHGAAQQLLKNRLPWQLHLPAWLGKVFKLIPGLLLAGCVVVALRFLPFSLVDIEPFDAWVFRAAGWATITIAVVGLVASLFVPMAYCRYGCPTGALLNFFRFNSRSDIWSPSDWFAVLLVLLSLGLWITF